MQKDCVVVTLAVPHETLAGCAVLAHRFVTFHSPIRGYHEDITVVVVEFINSNARQQLPGQRTTDYFIYIDVHEIGPGYSNSSFAALCRWW